MATKSAILTENITIGGQTTTSSTTYTSTASTSIEETIADSVTDQLMVVTIDVSAVKCLYLVSTAAVLVETNSSSSPVDTITLVANKPYIFHTDSYDTFKFGTDVTAIYLTNASGSAATVNLDIIYDATP